MENFSEPADWTFPIPIHYGPGRIADLPEIAKRNGMTKPLIVTDRGSENLPFVGELLDRLNAAGLHTSLFAGFSPNPLDHEAEAGKIAFVSGQHDGVIALGGGSGMDGGKAVALLAGCDVPVAEIDYQLPVPKAEHFPPLICVPTTAGTGAETESTAMITDTDRGIKICIAHPDLHPCATILDPGLTIGLPASLTAWTGVDAMVHAIEAYSVPDFHPLCDGAALEALRLIGGALKTAHAEPENINARGAMLVGSCLAGISFIKGLGLVHSISHMVGAVYNTHHGLTNAVMLPPVLRYNEPSLGKKAGEMAHALGYADESFAGLYAGIVETLDSLSIPTGLADLGVEESEVASLAEKAMGDSATDTNPRPISLPEMKDLIRSGLRDNR